ncbi:hypothetical protein AKH09_23685 [Vibrio parahaemolyticus]|nr:hypothetical protein AKH09_23685 [Vibrio parahaemolyticus]
MFMNKISEFLDAYSDDQIYLEMIEKLVNDHPVEANVPENIKYSSFSRLWVVMSVGSIEAMITEWTKNQPMLFDVREYFDNGSNEERIQRLVDAFNLRGIPVNEELFKDYLAVKYIRNAYVHGNWSENQKAYVVQRGFPDNCMNFCKSDFDRFKEIYYHILQCLGFMKVQNDMLSRASSLHCILEVLCLRWHGLVSW